MTRCPDNQMAADNKWQYCICRYCPCISAYGVSLLGIYKQMLNQVQSKMYIA